MKLVFTTVWDHVEPVVGEYRQCPVCQAPPVHPFPRTWTLEGIKYGPQDGPVETFLTPHAEQCDAEMAEPNPGLAIRTSGEYVTLVEWEQ